MTKDKTPIEELEALLARVTDEKPDIEAMLSKDMARRGLTREQAIAKAIEGLKDMIIR